MLVLLGYMTAQHFMPIGMGCHFCWVKVVDYSCVQVESVTNVPYVDCNYLYVRFCHGCFVFYNDDRSNREDVYHHNYPITYNSKASRDLQSMM